MASSELLECSSASQLCACKTSDEVPQQRPASVHYVKIDSSRQLESDFEFGETLGEGAFAKCCWPSESGTASSLRQLTAPVPQLAKNKDTKSTYGKSWENEIRVLRRFQHANIVQLEIIFESESNCYLFMELCDAGTLADELNRRRQFQEADTRCLLRQVGSALSFLHKSRIVHRDLKLQNCLLKARCSQKQQPQKARRVRSHHSLAEDDISASCPFDVKLTDFGLSIELRCLEHSLVDNVGTPVYQAPEIVNGSSYNYKCDVWALGIIAYCMLHGRCPYDDSDDLTEAISMLQLCRGLRRLR
uniref:Protein kinase domain-containing protein n=1 Tax=Macrostomum lignano TaxID=282301 RepID=A0A1I8IIG8_9PLAT